MPQRLFDTAIWDDPRFEGCSIEAKLLYFFANSASRSNQAGMFRISPDAISLHTGIQTSELAEIFAELEPWEIIWYPDLQIIWARQFLDRQTHSSNFLMAVLDSIKQLPDDLQEEFLNYNHKVFERYQIKIAYKLTRRECVIIRDNFRCAYCGKEILEDADYEVDHVYPTSRGGRDNYLNMVASCQGCNRVKNDRSSEEADLKTPATTTFHASQAVAILKAQPEVLERWLQIFPKRANVVATLLNIDQRQPILLPTSDDVNQSRATLGNILGSESVLEPGSVSESDKGAVHKRTADPRVKQILDQIREYCGYPDRRTEDPIPNPAKESTFVKKMFNRGFTLESVVDYWKRRINERGGEFISATWINEDIGKRPRSRALPTGEELAASWGKGGD